MTIFKEIQSKYKASNALVQLVMLNVGVFLLIRLMAIILHFAGVNSNAMLEWMVVPSDLTTLLHRPWTLLTYMFAHYDMLHVLFNMLWLYWLGKLFLEYFNSKQLVALYVLGGLGGALVYVLGYAVLPVFAGKVDLLIGASGAVLALVTAMAVFAPDYRIGLLFLGQVSLKWLAIGVVVLMVLGGGDGQLGAQLAHLGGGLVGVFYGWQMRRGHDITAWLNRIIDKLVNLTKRPRKKGVGGPVGGKAYHYQQNATSSKQTKKTSSNVPTEAEIDVILDKLKRSGYGALTEEEKATLFRASGKK